MDRLTRTESKAVSHYGEGGPPARVPRLLLLLLLCHFCLAQKTIPVSSLLNRMIRTSSLAEPGGRDFYLKATITDKDDAKSQFNGTVEEYWVSTTKWRRTIKLRDFSQTKIVNGDQVYEDNQGDYFPLDDQMLAEEIVDPLPTPVVDLISSFGLTVHEPGSGTGQCMVEHYFKNADGKDERILLAYDCKTSLLIYVWAPTCCYGVMTDYRQFHEKTVAYATKDDPINIRINELKDLNAPEDSLFAVPQPTPPDKRITRITLTEGQSRALIKTRADVTWPVITKKQPEKEARLELVIGRDGQVKEAHCYSPLDASIKDAVLAAVEKWKFQPQTVDGIPAQIDTHLTITLPDQSAAAGVDVGAVFDKVRKITDLRSTGSPAFHLHATFHAQDGKADGTYEETWASPTKWRREVNLNSTSLLEIRNEDDFYRVFPGKYAARRADDIVDFLAFTFPGDEGKDIYPGDWASVDTQLGNIPMLRLSHGYVSPHGSPDPMAEIYFVEKKSSVLRARYHYSVWTLFNELQPFGQKLFPRKITANQSDVKNMEIHVDSLELAPNVDESLFQLPGIKPRYNFSDEQFRFGQPRLVYSVRPPVSSGRKIICQLRVDEHGHVREVEVKNTTDESLITAIRAALMTWEYEPSTIRGHPVMSQAQVIIE